MTTARDPRRCAIQALYQLDAAAHASAGRAAADQGSTEQAAAGTDETGTEETESSRSLEIIRQSLQESPGGERSHREGYELAIAAWALRAEADAAVSALAPDWPTYRQPVVDRSILRLAYYEMISGRTPPKVAINEAVELAREFSTEKSPLFVNGVLDKIYKSMPGAGDDDSEEPAPAADEIPHVETPRERITPEDTPA